ncbi:hypothetical protein O23A_p0481 [Aeromonas salmonicida]|nr:hypothetical protein O23A_p0481 [Aeromonas salmonicida]
MVKILALKLKIKGCVTIVLRSPLSFYLQSPLFIKLQSRLNPLALV